jgi:hypothetical protein
MKVTRSANFDEVELLKFPVGLHAQKSIALDGMDFTFTAGQRNIIPKGTILKVSATNPDKHTEYRGTGTITGILGKNVDLVAQATEGVEPGANMFFKACVFATTAIVGFTQYASALVSTLGASPYACSFE